MNNWLVKPWHIYAIEYSATVKNKEALWALKNYLQGILLSEKKYRTAFCLVREYT